MRLALLALLGLALASCDAAGADAPTEPVTIDISPEARALIGQSNDFGLRLFAETAGEGNLMLSPLSASVALTMLLNGADGATYDQIHTMLGYAPGQDLPAINASYQSLRSQLLAADPQVQFTLANAVFYRDTFGPAIQAPFLDAMRTAFDARVGALDFGSPSALEAINGWASASTNGKIPEVLDEISPELVMLLMNALYFKGSWSTEFDEAQTATGAFELAGGTTVDVPMMSGMVEARLASGEGWRAAELPYGRRNFSFVAIVPDAPLGDAVGELAAGLWADVARQLDGPTGEAETWTEAEVRMPRFTFETDAGLNEPLQTLGMVDAFDGRADLSRIAPGLKVDFVKQNTFVDVNEEGTEAAAVTTIGIDLTSAGPSFAADRPFVFAIRERTTDTLLFIGQVADPRE